jgi:hypothetical protein
MRVALKVRYDWGQTTPRSRAAATTSAMWARQTLRLNTDAPVSPCCRPGVCAHARTQLCWARRNAGGGIADTARDFEQETTAYWRNWSRAWPCRWNGRTR